MIVVECLYTSNEIEEETILREQQKRCLAAAASYGWAVRREVFEPLQLSAPEASMTEPASRRYWTMCATAASTC